MNATSLSDAPAFPTFRRAGHVLSRVTRVPRRIFLSRTSLKVYLIAGGLLFSGYTGHRWYGLRALAAEQDRVAALGIARDWKDLESPPPPDADNFFSAPPFVAVLTAPHREAPELCLWFGWRLPERAASPPRRPDGDNVNLAEWCAYFRAIGTLPESTAGESPARSLASDTRFRPVIDSLYSAAERSESRVPGEIPRDYRSIARTDFYAMARGLQFYARANPELGETHRATPALRVFRHLLAAAAANGNCWSCEIFLDCQKPLLLEGISAHRLPEETLRAILAENYPEMMRAAARRAMEIQRIHLVTNVEAEHFDWVRNSGVWSSRKLTEALWGSLTIYSRALQYSRHQAGMIERAASLAEGETWGSRVTALAAGSADSSKSVPWDQRADFVRRLVRPILLATLHHTAAALETHRLRHGRYPAELSGLETGLPENALRDENGRPFAYATDAEGTRFTLSAGEMCGTWSTAHAKPYPFYISGGLLGMPTIRNRRTPPVSSASRKGTGFFTLPGAASIFHPAIAWLRSRRAE